MAWRHKGNGPLVRYVTWRVAHAPGMPGTFIPPPRVRDPDMHHGTCVTHVPWCMPGSLTSGFLCISRYCIAPVVPEYSGFRSRLSHMHAGNTYCSKRLQPNANFLFLLFPLTKLFCGYFTFVLNFWATSDIYFYALAPLQSLQPDWWKRQCFTGPRWQYVRQARIHKGLITTRVGFHSQSIRNFRLMMITRWRRIHWKSSKIWVSWKHVTTHVA